MSSAASPRPVERPEFEVAIIGAGPGGIAAGVKLKRAGIDDFVVLERADEVGGSWHENHYPGLGVDIPCYAYQSVSVPGLPNRWTLVGPYSWTGSGWHAFVEMTADHAVRAITEAKRRAATAVEVKRSRHDAYHRDIHRRGAALRYYLAELNGHVPTYYRNSRGDTTYVRPSGFFEARRGNRRFPLDDYDYRSLNSETLSGTTTSARPA
ncbi:Pyridine nucleotide-disulphide oxidoreductase [Nocardia amikacinitolerans]|uniref:Pyridine nucleotide-disulphide oxidoreductase n=1 Tax=Nocardia amikacinitolerans TaxID=756689 RepID=A0A285LR61_9NOCA|nr:NAD(P)-binding protein [Nocardia amikacinitolerans]SNY87420.1 Pyridine nucleotide-disulphide oxidoreductase [Nocardia amikacinitolerans]